LQSIFIADKTCNIREKFFINMLKLAESGRLRMINIEQIDHLLNLLQAQIFTAVGAPVALEFCETRSEDRAAVVNGGEFDWRPVGPETVWGEPQSYFWFSGRALVPEEAAGKRLYLHVEAQLVASWAAPTRNVWCVSTVKSPKALTSITVSFSSVKKPKLGRPLTFS
jgi:hypothetical protein